MPPGRVRRPLEGVLGRRSLSPPYPAPRNALRACFQNRPNSPKHGPRIAQCGRIQPPFRFKCLRRVRMRARTRWHTIAALSNALSAYGTSRLDLDSGPGIAPTVVEIHHSSAQTTFRGYWGGVCRTPGKVSKNSKNARATSYHVWSKASQDACNQL